MVTGHAALTRPGALALALLRELVGEQLDQLAVVRKVEQQQAAIDRARQAVADVLGALWQRTGWNLLQRHALGIALGEEVGDRVGGQRTSPSAGVPAGVPANASFGSSMGVRPISQLWALASQNLAEPSET